MWFHALIGTAGIVLLLEEYESNGVPSCPDTVTRLLSIQHRVNELVKKLSFVNSDKSE